MTENDMFNTVNEYWYIIEMLNYEVYDLETQYAIVKKYGGWND